MDGPRPPEFAPLEDGTPPHPDAGYEHFDRLEHVRKPVIACIHGYTVGGGVEITLCADIRLATEDALLGTPEPRSNGGMPGIAVHRLAQLVPHAEAMRIMLTLQPITGRRAYDVGLVRELAADVDRPRCGR